MKIKVITSIVGEGRDYLTPIMPHEDPDVEFIAYTTQQSDYWISKPPCNIFTDKKKNAKIHKILIHKYEDCDVSIWIDGNIILKECPNKIINDLLGDSDLALATQTVRGDVFTEGIHIKKCMLDYPDIVDKQLEKYKHKEQELKNKGLLFGAVLIRRHNKATENFNEAWWAEICTNSFRDQISLPYILLNNPDLKVNTFDAYTFWEYFHRTHHYPITYR
jgi:hypothetical protein